MDYFSIPKDIFFVIFEKNLKNCNSFGDVLKAARYARKSYMENTTIDHPNKDFYLDGGRKLILKRMSEFLTRYAPEIPELQSLRKGFTFSDKTTDIDDYHLFEVKYKNVDKEITASWNKYRISDERELTEENNIIFIDNNSKEYSSVECYSYSFTPLYFACLQEEKFLIFTDTPWKAESAIFEALMTTDEDLYYDIMLIETPDGLILCFFEGDYSCAMEEPSKIIIYNVNLVTKKLEPLDSINKIIEDLISDDVKIFSFCSFGMLAVDDENIPQFWKFDGSKVSIPPNLSEICKIVNSSGLVGYFKLESENEVIISDKDFNIIKKLNNPAFPLFDSFVLTETKIKGKKDKKYNIEIRDIYTDEIFLSLDTKEHYDRLFITRDDNLSGYILWLHKFADE